MENSRLHRSTGPRRLLLFPLCFALLPLAQSPPTGSAQTVTTSITPSALPACAAPCGSGVTTVTPSGTTHNITGGARPGNGTNLFHSFDTFSVGAPDKANFVNDLNLPTTNIVSRVTGGSPSNIFGTLQTTNFGTAALWLINPAGIVVGPTASLNVGGSVHFSTADYLRMFDGVTGSHFYADLSKSSQLSSAPVTAFGFLGANPTGVRAIEVSSLHLSGPQDFSLVGRDLSPTVAGITVDGGQVSHPGGRIHLTSVGAPLDPNAGGEVSALDFSPAGASSGRGFAGLGGIVMRNNGFLSVSNGSGPAAGQIVIRGGRLTMEGGARLLARTTDANTLRGGIDAHVTGPMTLSGPHSAIDTEVIGSATIPGGDIRIRAGSLAVTDGAQIRTTNSSGHPGAVGGTIDIIAETITLSGTIDGGGAAVSSGLFSGTARDTPGNGGNIHLTATNLSLLDGGTIDASTQGFGKAGNIDTSATGILLSGVNTTNGISTVPSAISSKATRDPASEGADAFELTGNGGNIQIRTTTLDILGGAQLDARTQTGGNGGNVDVVADRVAISGAAGVLRSGISTGSDIGGEGGGNGGQITLTATSLLLTDKGAVDLGTNGSGSGGSLNVNADRITIASGGIVSSGSFGNGIAGNLSLSSRSFTMTDAGSGLSVRTFGPGNGGTIALHAEQALLGPGSTIDSRTSSSFTRPAPTMQATGGSVNVTVTNDLVLEGALVAASTSGVGDAGSILIRSGEMSMDNRSAVSSASTAAATGRAGSITITATGPFRSSGGTVTTAANNGQGGTISIHADQILLNSGAAIAANSAGPLDAGNILLTAGDRIMLQDSAVSTSASEASGGGITLQASNLIRLRNARITSSVLGGPDTSGGDITIDPQAVLLQHNSRILAQALAGSGGNISIVAGVMIVEPGSFIDASSQLGISGQVSVQAPIQSLAGLMTPLPQSFVSNTTLYGQRCAARKSGQFSSFVQGTRDALPVQPGDSIPSPLLLEDPASPPGATGLSEPRDQAAPSPGPDSTGRFSVLSLPLFAGCRS